MEFSKTFWVEELTDEWTVLLVRLAPVRWTYDNLDIRFKLCDVVYFEIMTGDRNTHKKKYIDITKIDFISFDDMFAGRFKYLYYIHLPRAISMLVSWQNSSYVTQSSIIDLMSH